jgi:hypothetical protein
MIEALCSSKSWYCNHLPTYECHIPEVHSVCVCSLLYESHVLNKTRPCFTHISCMQFSFNVPYQFTPLLNFRFLVFGLTLFGWFISIYLFSLYMNIIFDLHFFDLCQLFQENLGCKTRSCIWYVCAMS